MRVARLFAQPDAEVIERENAELREIVKKLRAELHNTRHRKSGSYNFRLEEVRDMAKGLQAIESGDRDYGVRIMASVMDELRPDWRDLS